MEHYGCSLLIGLLFVIILLLLMVILWMYKYEIDKDYIYAVWYNDEGSTIIIEKNTIILRPDINSDKTYSQESKVSRDIFSLRNNAFYVDTPMSKYKLLCDVTKGEIAVYKDGNYLGIYSKNLISSLSD